MYRQSRCPRTNVSSNDSFSCRTVLMALCAGVQCCSHDVLAAKVHALVVRGVDVAGPEQADVAALEDVLRRPAAEREVDVVRLDQREVRPAFEEERRRRRLVQLGLASRRPSRMSSARCAARRRSCSRPSGRAFRRRRCARSSGPRRSGRRGWSSRSCGSGSRAPL